MKSSLIKSAALAVIFGISAFAAASSASAQSGNCQWYALQSAKQQQVNLAKKCGNSGSEWSKNVRTHKAYCEKVGPDASQKTMAKRAKALQSCK